MNIKTIRNGWGILVIEHGNVIYGHYEISDDDDMITVKDGKVIRRWGTERGLGELAANGPRPDTVLDPLNRDTWVSKKSLIFVIDCEPEQW